MHIYLYVYIAGGTGIHPNTGQHVYSVRTKCTNR